MRIVLDLVAVHVGARIALVRIADDVFLSVLALARKSHLFPVRTAGPSAAAQPRRFYLLDDGFGPRVDQDFIKRLIPSRSDVLLDIFGIDQNPQLRRNDFLLAFEERHFGPTREFPGIPAHISNAM